MCVCIYIYVYTSVLLRRHIIILTMMYTVVLRSFELLYHGSMCYRCIYVNQFQGSHHDDYVIDLLLSGAGEAAYLWGVDQTTSAINTQHVCKFLYILR